MGYPGVQGYTGVRWPSDLFRHTVRLVAAARGERPCRRAGRRAARARPRGHRARPVGPRARSARRSACPARGELGKVVALGAAVPVSRRSSLGVPVGVRANLALALRARRLRRRPRLRARVPSLSYLALLDTDTLTVATFLSVDRLVYPPARAQRDRLLGRVDALLATSRRRSARPAERFPGDYRVVPLGVDLSCTRPEAKPKRSCVELRSPARAGRSLRDTGDPRAARQRSTRRTISALRARRGTGARPCDPRRACGSPVPRSSYRLRAERTRAEAMARRPRSSAAGNRASNPSSPQRPPAGGSTIRLPRAGGTSPSRAPSFEAVAASSIASTTLARRDADHSESDPLADRDWIVADLHMHTSWSHDCSVAAADLLDHAEEIGLGAIAVTDHNVFGGALEAVELARAAT